MEDRIVLMKQVRKKILARMRNMRPNADMVSVSVHTLANPLPPSPLSLMRALFY